MPKIIPHSQTLNGSKPILIVGSGIAGFVLAFELFKKNAPFFIFSDRKKAPASAAAGALLNYFNAARNKIAEEDFRIFPQALAWYQDLEVFFQKKFLHAYSLQYKTEQGDTLIHRPCYWLDIQLLLQLFEDFFQEIIVDTEVHSSEITWQEDTAWVHGRAYARVIFCTGASARHDPLWQHIPFTANRGEALLLHLPEAKIKDVRQIEKSKLLPMHDNQFWWGARHLWDFDDLEPDHTWAQSQLEILRKNTGLVATILKHYCAERPTTAGQRTVLEMHPRYPKTAAIITGLGSKGILRAAALIPTFAARCVFPDSSPRL